MTCHEGLRGAPPCTHRSRRCTCRLPLPSVTAPTPPPPTEPAQHFAAGRPDHTIALTKLSFSRAALTSLPKPTAHVAFGSEVKTTHMRMHAHLHRPHGAAHERGHQRGKVEFLSSHLHFIAKTTWFPAPRCFGSEATSFHTRTHAHAQACARTRMRTPTCTGHVAAHRRAHGRGAATSQRKSENEVFWEASHWAHGRAAFRRPRATTVCEKS